MTRAGCARSGTCLVLTVSCAAPPAAPYGRAAVASGCAPAPTHRGRLPAQNFKEFVGTAEYMPPEAINNQPADYRADLWCFGGTLFHMVAGVPPFKGGSEYLTFKRVLELKYRFPVGVPEETVDLIRRLLKVVPSERLGGGKESSAERHAAIKAHPYFAAIDWTTPLHSQRPPPATPAELATPESARALQALGGRLELPGPIPPAPPPPPKPKKGASPNEAALAEHAAACAARDAAVAARSAQVASLVQGGDAFASVRDAPYDHRRRIALYLDVRGLLTEELRVALQMPEPEPEIVDEIEPLPDSDDEAEAAG